MVTQLRGATRTARKAYRCHMCTAAIEPGERYHVSTNVFDGRLYDFRVCDPCREDRITSEVFYWCGMPDEGVTAEDAWEWAHEARHAGSSHPEIVHMAEDWLRRCDCQCERCVDTSPERADLTESEDQ